MIHSGTGLWVGQRRHVRLFRHARRCWPRSRRNGRALRQVQRSASARSSFREARTERSIPPMPNGSSRLPAPPGAAGTVRQEAGRAAGGRTSQANGSSRTPMESPSSNTGWSTVPGMPGRAVMPADHIPIRKGRTHRAKWCASFSTVRTEPVLGPRSPAHVVRHGNQKGGLCP